MDEEETGTDFVIDKQTIIRLYNGLSDLMDFIDECHRDSCGCLGSGEDDSITAAVKLMDELEEKYPAIKNGN